MRLAIVLLGIIAGFASCKKDKPDFDSFWQCNQSQNLDSIAFAGKLIGSWIWNAQSCEASPTSADKKIKVTFRIDHTFQVNEMQLY
jgi:hypothetical protein